MKYFFIVDNGYVSRIYFYKTLADLLFVEEEYMKNNNNWYIIKGELIKMKGDLNGLRNNYF